MSKILQIDVLSRNNKGENNVTRYTSDNIGEVSDGYHSFDDLYMFRMLYNAAFFNSLQEGYEAEGFHNYGVCKSHLHSDSTQPFGGGWFVVTAQLPTGQITNHYEDIYWDLFDIREVAKAPEYDGHTPGDVMRRMKDYLLGNY